MKILRKISLAIVAIIVLFFVVAIFLPSEYKVERSIEINLPADSIYNYVADFNNFQAWNPWTPLEPGHKYEVTGDSASVGQRYFWEGKTIGSGQMTFTELKPYSYIKSDIEFLKPNSGKGIVEWNFEQQGNSTKVTWGIIGEAGYPIGRYFGLMMDGFLGKSFEDGMKNLKKNCEAK